MVTNKMMGKGGDMSQDKALIKKAFKQHDTQEHKGGKGTALQLKNGGKVNASKNPGLAKLPTQVRNKMGYMNSGGKVKRYAAGSEGGVQSETADFKVTPEMMEKSKADLATSGNSNLSSKRTTIGQPYAGSPLPREAFLNETEPASDTPSLSKTSEKAEPAGEKKFNSFKEAYAHYKQPKNGGEGSTFEYNGKKILIQDKATPTEKAKMNTAMAARTEDRAYKSLEEPSKESSKNPMNKGNEKAKTKFESFRNAPSPLDNIKTSAQNIGKKLGFANGGMVKARQTVKSLGKAC
jgi:hypothetical protein